MMKLPSCSTNKVSVINRHNFSNFSCKNRGKYRIYATLLLLLFYSLKLFLLNQKNQQNSVYQIKSPDFIEQFSSPNSRHLLGINIAAKPLTAFNCTPLAIENFPKDSFTQKQRRSGAVFIHIFATAYMFLALAIVCDEYFIPCLEIISEVLKLQPDVAGATFMAAGSSAPELATTLVGVFIARDDIGLGAVVGSADYNVMFVISVCALFSKEIIYLNWWPLVRDCFFYLISIILLAAVIVDEKVYWYESILFLLFYCVYILVMRFNPILDKKANSWCLAHPRFCPRAIHSGDSQVNLAVQSSGKFASAKQQIMNETGKGVGFNGPDQFVTNYSRLEEEETTASITQGGDFAEGETVITLPISNVSTENLGSKPADTWAQTCFGVLRYPPPEAGIFRRIYFFIAWPIRLCLCLTTPDCKSKQWRRYGGHWITFVMSCIWIGVFTLIMMWMITVIGLTLGIPDTIMGLTFIAAGSSVPDAITSVIVVREGEGDMAVSNAVGSNIFDILICMGFPWLLRSIIIQGPVLIYSEGLTYSALTLFATVLLLLAATHINRWRLTKAYGVYLMIAYLAFLIICSLYELNIFGMVHPPECKYTESP